MGLPLFTPPVESDVPHKCAAKRAADSSHARTPIGRAERTLNRRRQYNETREQRLRMLAALQAADIRSWPARTALRRSSTTRPNARSTDAQQAPPPGRQIPRTENSRTENPHNENSRTSDLARSSSRTPETQWPQPFTPETLITFNDSFDDAIIPHLVAPLASPPFRYRPLGHNHSVLSGRSISARGVNAESRRRLYPDPLDDFDDEEVVHFAPLIVSSAERYNAANAPNSIPAHRQSQRVRYVDGLGDRDRSLSPEGDGVWDTLQSTLTPDPQPPSVNSSFTSTVISTAAPHSNGPNSVHTSMTTPNEEADPPCDPVMDALGSDGEDDYGSRYETQRPVSGLRFRRSYADVAADLNSRLSPDMGDPEEEWLSGMHRIVRGLVSRDDIPDEWWARAGLSRSMSWEDST